MTELICIVCPKGCHLKVDENNDFAVTGHGCARGIDYGQAELKNPTRVITSTVAIEGAAFRRCPVKTSGVIPKAVIFDVVRALDPIRLQSPVKAGEVVLPDVCGTGVDIITTRAM